MKIKDFINVCNQNTCVLHANGKKFTINKVINCKEGVFKKFVCVLPYEGGKSSYFIDKSTLKSVHLCSFKNVPIFIVYKERGQKFTFTFKIDFINQYNH